ncbi:hypothetical protein [Bacteroides graminisolvens]
MTFKVNDKLINIFLALAETGMGYQIIDAKKYGAYISNKFIVYNAELVVDYDNYEDSLSLLRDEYDMTLLKSPYIDLEEIVLSNRPSENKKGRSEGGTAAIDNRPVDVNIDDFFVRLSAYKNDRRIDFNNKRLRKGSYTTTWDDYLKCKGLNDDPIDRYALPNDQEIKWAFKIKPSIQDKYRPGIVQPAYNHEGGGVEAFFDNGTCPWTYKGVIPY